MSNNLTQATCYLYDGNNNLTQVVAPNGATRTFTYDALSRFSSATTPEGGTVSYTYDGSGNVFTRVAPKENQTSSSVTVTTTYSYDALNRLTQKSYNDSTTPAAYYVYDQSSAWGGVVTDPKNTSNPTKYAYESMDRLQSRTDPLGNSETYAYDGNNNLASFTDRRGKITTYNYDALNRLTFAGFNTQPGPVYDSTINYTYDLGNRLTKAADSIAGTFSRSYVGLDRLTQEQGPESKVSYSYGNVGRPVNVIGTT